MATIPLPNAERVVKVMLDMASDLRRRAEELERHAKELAETGDLDSAVAGLSVAVSTQNLSAHMLLNSTIREMERSQKG